MFCCGAARDGYFFALRFTEFGRVEEFAAIVWAVGHPVSEADSTTVIGYVAPGSPAEKVGLQPGDKILAVDGKPVRRFLGMKDSISWDVVRSEGDKVRAECPFIRAFIDKHPEFHDLKG